MGKDEALKFLGKLFLIKENLLNKIPLYNEIEYEAFRQWSASLPEVSE